MDAKSFIKIGLFGISIPAVNIESAFAWKCSRGVEHKKDEACFCCWQWERACDNPMCTSDYHSGYEVCPQSVFGFRSEGIKYVILPYRVPERKIAELWYEYGCSNVRRDERYAEYCPEIEPDRNIETERLEFSVQQLKEKFSEENKKLRGQFQKGKEVQESEEKKRRRLEKISTFLQQEKKKIGVPMSDAEKEEERKKMEEIKRREEAEKLAIKERSLKRKLQEKKDKK